MIALLVVARCAFACVALVEGGHLLRWARFQAARRRGVPDTFPEEWTRVAR